MFIILLTLIILALVSFFLTRLSMRHFPAISAESDQSGLFLIANSQLLTQDLIEKLYGFCLEQKCIISLERLFKGEESALVLFGPSLIAQYLPELNFLELEDYIRDDQSGLGGYIKASECLVWQPELVKGEVKKNYLNSLALEGDQQFGLQLILMPEKADKRSSQRGFKIVIRLLVASPKILDRITFAKGINTLIINSLGLKKSELHTSPQLLKLYKGRAYLVSGKEVKVGFDKVRDYLSL